MKLTPAKARAITRDWQCLFPTLAVYGPLHLMRRCGPLLVGICLDRTSSGDEYRPKFHCHCLLRKSPAITLSLYVQLIGSRGAKTSVKVRRHEAMLQEAAAKMRALALLPLDVDFGVGDYEAAAVEWMRRWGAFCWPGIIEDLILVKSWAGVDYSDNLVAAEAALRSWPNDIVMQLGGVAAWMARVESSARNRDELESVFASEMRAHRLEGLPSGDLIPS
jgi:hypothetical protein